MALWRRLWLRSPGDPYTPRGPHPHHTRPERADATARSSTKESFVFKDGRTGAVTNSAFGAVYGVVDGKSYPVCDSAGYASFGFGYRRCAGEYLTVEFVKEFLRTVWNEKLTSSSLTLARQRKCR